MDGQAQRLGAQLQALNRIGIALSSERDSTALLNLILAEARKFTGAEGASLYLIEGDHLNFKVTQNEKLGSGLVGMKLPLSKESLSGYVALTGEVLNIADAYDLPPDAPYRFNKKFDEDKGYRTRSLLHVPITTPQGELLGVLQLINARNEEGTVIPFDASLEELVRSLGSQAAVSYLNAKLTQDLRAAYYETIFRLCLAAEFRDDDTAVHIRRMSSYCAIMARGLGWEPEVVEDFRVASQMHDVGKLGIPDAILQKPGKLTDEEYEVMRTHTLIGGKILGNAQAPVLKLSQTIALSHHEKWDGTGYPNRLAQEQIPLEGRINAIADVFDALSSPRCYKPPFPLEKALGIMKEGGGKHFDPTLLELFLKNLDEVLKVKDEFARQQADAKT